MASLKGKISIPASHHVQTTELAQVEKDRVDLADTLAKEKEEKEKIAEEMVVLQGRLKALQETWDTHTCAPPPAPPETSSLFEQLTTAVATNNALEKQVSTVRLRISELEAILAENSKIIEAIRKEVEQGKKEKSDQQKSIDVLKNHLKGNITLREDR